MINKFVTPAAVAMVAAVAFGVLAKAEPPAEQRQAQRRVRSRKINRFATPQKATSKITER
jgi:hypothetical protein